MSESAILQRVLNEASSGNFKIGDRVSVAQQEYLDTIVSSATSGRQKSVLAVVTTLLLLSKTLDNIGKIYPVDSLVELWIHLV